MSHFLLSIGFIYCVVSLTTDFLHFQHSPNPLDSLTLLETSLKMLWAILVSFVLQER